MGFGFLWGGFSGVTVLHFRVPPPVFSRLVFFHVFRGGSGHQVAFRGGLRGSSEVRMVSPLSSCFVRSSRFVRVAPRPLVCHCGDKEFIPKELPTKDVKSCLLTESRYAQLGFRVAVAAQCPDPLSEPFGSIPIIPELFR